MKSYFSLLSEALLKIDTSSLNSVADRIQSSVKRCGTVWIFGNGGSFANAQHWACDLQKSAGIRAMPLGSNGSLTTAISNDIRYDDAASIELDRMYRPGDMLIVLSCSGCSPNVIRLILKAREVHITSVLITGSIHRVMSQADLVICIDSIDYGVIEDCHAAIGHWITNELYKSK